MRHDNSKQNAVILILTSVFALAMIIVIFPVHNFSLVTSTNNAQDTTVKPELKNATISTGSIVNGSKVFIIAPNNTSIQNALDNVCQDNKGICSTSSPKFLIKSSIILWDSNHVQYPSSTLVNIPLQSFLPWTEKIVVKDTSGKIISTVPKLSLTDSQGHLLDLGTAQLGIYGVTNVDTDVVVTGVFSVYLDDKVVYSKQFATQGKTVNNIIPITNIGENGIFTFTFADEPLSAGQHIFKILVGNVVATVGTGANTNIFQYSNAAPVYLIVMNVDDQKVTTIGIDNKAVAMFKADDNLETCGRNDVVTVQGVLNSNDIYVINGITHSGPSNTGLVSVYENGFLITSGQSNAGQASVDGEGGVSTNAGVKTCTTVSGIPRDADLVISAGGQYYNVHTPVTQTTLVYDCSGTVSNTDPINSRGQNRITGGCTNNFNK